MISFIPNANPLCIYLQLLNLRYYLSASVGANLFAQPLFILHQESAIHSHNSSRSEFVIKFLRPEFALSLSNGPVLSLSLARLEFIERPIEAA